MMVEENDTAAVEELEAKPCDQWERGVMPLTEQQHLRWKTTLAAMSLGLIVWIVAAVAQNATGAQVMRTRKPHTSQDPQHHDFGNHNSPEDCNAVFYGWHRQFFSKLENSASKMTLLDVGGGAGDKVTKLRSMKANRG